MKQGSSTRVLNTSKYPTPVVVIGAGPYGLSVAAHLRTKGVPFRIFGQPMQTWATQMPEGMRLKSDGFASNLSTGGAPYSLAQFCEETGREYHDTLLPVPLEHFIAYGQEFARRYVPNLEPEDVRSVVPVDGMYRITTAADEQFYARRVVVATGLSLFQHMPPAFRRLPAARVTHPAQHRRFDEFAGREVTVLGRGASSLNAAVLLHEAGAKVTLIGRARKLHIHHPGDPATRPWMKRLLHPSTPLGTSMRSWLACAAPDVFRAFPAALRRAFVYKHLGPAGGTALQGRLEGFPILLGCRIHAIEPADGSGEKLRITLTDGNGAVRQHLTSHLIAGTGYRTDLSRLSFLSPTLRERIRVDQRGAPKLSRSFQSAAKGLYFAGPIAAPGFGPLLRFVAGAGFAAERVSSHLQRSWLQERHRLEVKTVVRLSASAPREQLSR